MAPGDRIQLQVDLPFKQQPAEHAKVRALLDNGYRVVSLDRLTDREALVTLERVPAGAKP